jgi:endoglucanase
MKKSYGWCVTVMLLPLAAGMLAWLAIAPAESRAANQAAAADAFSLNEKLGRGVNILGYDPLWQNPAKARFQEMHFKLIKEAGFDNVRVVLHPFRDGRPDAQHRLSTSWFKTLDKIVEQALANHLLVILDFHEYAAMGQDPEGKKDRFLAIWGQIAEHFKDAPKEVLFEALNEPNKKLTPELWNQYFREALAVIRKSNPGRVVVVGPGNWNNINALGKLELPEDDRNLIVTVHYYNPFPFTHQGASWAGLKDKVGIAWNETPKECQDVEHDLDKAQAWAVQHRRPLFLGEFGAYDKGEMASRVRWTNFVARQAEKRGWSWAYWQFDSDFVVYDMKRQQWKTPIRDALVPASK